MSLDLTQLDTDVGNMIDDLPLTIQFDGQSELCTRSTLRRSHVMAVEGLRDRYHFSVYTRNSDWTTIPSEGDVVTIAAVEYRVLDREFDNALQLVRLDLGDKYSV